MTETKLHIEVAGAVLDVEGDAALVREVYEDFKEQIAASAEAVAVEKAVVLPVQVLPTSDAVVADPAARRSDGTTGGDDIPLVVALTQ